MIVVTVATDSVAYFPNLVEQCDRLGLELRVLGFGQKWKGFQWRFQLMREFLSGLAADEVVVFVDGYDVLPLRGPKAIMDAFLEAQTPVLLSVEHRVNFLNWWLYRKTFGNCRGLQLNAGMYMGYAHALLKLYDEICTTTDCAVLDQDDQTLLSGLCRTSVDTPGSFFATQVKFDINSTVFMNLSSANWSSIEWRGNKLFMVDDVSNRLVQRQTRREPCFLHGPGNIDMAFATRLYGMRDLGLVAQTRGTLSYYGNAFKLYSYYFASELIAASVLLIILIAMIVYWVLRRRYLRRERKRAQRRRQLEEE
jgi:uncharacterized membrane protein